MQARKQVVEVKARSTAPVAAARSASNTAPSTSSATANPVTFTVPASALRDGANVITAQVQSNYKATPNVSFELAAKVK